MKQLVFILTLFVSLQAMATSPSMLVHEAEKKGITLSEDEKSILEMGEISDTKYIVGGILGTYPLGFGIGHAIQGTWSYRGWIFTVSELTSLAVLISGLSSCDWDFDEDEDLCSGGASTAVTVGLFSFIGFRIWEIVDVWAGVPKYRRKQNELKEYIEGKDSKEKITLDLAPLYSPRLNAGGLQLVLNF